MSTTIKTKDGSTIIWGSDLGKMNIGKAIKTIEELNGNDAVGWRLPNHQSGGWGSQCEVEAAKEAGIVFANAPYFESYKRLTFEEVDDWDEDEFLRAEKKGLGFYKVSLYHGRKGGAYWTEGVEPVARLRLVKTVKFSEERMKYEMRMAQALYHRRFGYP